MVKRADCQIVSITRFSFSFQQKKVTVYLLTQVLVSTEFITTQFGVNQETSLSVTVSCNLSFCFKRLEDLDFMQLHPPLLLPHQTLLPLQLSHPDIAGTQTQDRSCWIQPANRGTKKKQSV